MAYKDKEKEKAYHRRYRKEHKEEIRKRNIEYREENKEELKELAKIRYIKNKEKINKNNKDLLIKIKIQAFDILGGCKCVICGDEELSHLTIDHIDKTGYLDKKIGFYSQRLYYAIALRRYPEEKLNNLRILCWNHNLGRNKEYLNCENQTNNQRYQTKLWQEAYEFFGPCKSCGNSDLIHLTISHIHNDGAEKRRNGERTATHLLSKFHKQDWPESLKEDYCLECFSCNCSKNFA